MAVTHLIHVTHLIYIEITLTLLCRTRPWRGRLIGDILFYTDAGLLERAVEHQKFLGLKDRGVTCVTFSQWIKSWLRMSILKHWFIKQEYLKPLICSKSFIVVDSKILRRPLITWGYRICLDSFGVDVYNNIISLCKIAANTYDGRIANSMLIIMLMITKINENGY